MRELDADQVNAEGGVPRTPVTGTGRLEQGPQKGPEHVEDFRNESPDTPFRDGLTERHLGDQALTNRPYARSCNKYATQR